MNYIKTYADFLKKFLNPQRQLKVVFDCSNGTAGPIIKRLTTDDQRLTTYFINDKMDGDFPAHGPNPLKKGALNDLRTAIKKYKADLGVIFDADADRVFFLDNKGEFVNPDAIARLLIWRLKPKKTIIDIRTGWLVKKYRVSSIKYQTSRVGHYFIKKLMRKIKADFGAEYSGHYYFPVKTGEEIAYIDSGILAAIGTINAVSELPYKLSDFIDLLPQYYRSGEINIKTNKESGIMNFGYLLKKIENRFKNKATKISHLDGITMEFENYWFNLRPSNTESLLRLNIETENKNLLRQKIKELSSSIKKLNF